jgi:argininosuccinate lyase
MTTLQWGGRFTGQPDNDLLAFGSSLEEDFILAPFDVNCSLAHVEALLGGAIISEADASLLRRALQTVLAEIREGGFFEHARRERFEDVHGAIDARVRELAGTVGERLHVGRSRNDQVATTLLLYVHDRADVATRAAHQLGASLVKRAEEELSKGTIVAGCTHRQPAQPLLLAFELVAWSEPFVRAAGRFAGVAQSAMASCPLGSAALAGSTLPLDRRRASAKLGFAAPSRNALDAIGNRDAALDLAHACVRAVIDASRIAEELVAWCAPAYGYVKLGDAASTGSSLMPQKHNPDPFELVRASAAKLVGSYAGALATLCGLAPSYQRDLQQTKAIVISIVEETLAVFDAFARAWDAVQFVRERMNATALDGFAIATDIADALIMRGATARAAHALVGTAVARAEAEQRGLDRNDLSWLAAEMGVDQIDGPLDARASVEAKRTAGSTSPHDVRAQISSLEVELADILASVS